MCGANFLVKLRKLLLSLFVLFLFASPAFAQEGSPDLEHWNQVAQELTQLSQSSNVEFQNLSQNLTDALKNAQSLSSQSSLSELESMSPWDLFDRLEETLMSLQLRVETLSSMSKNLEQDLSYAKKEIENLRVDLANYKKALTSNKEDTKYISELVAEAWSKIESLKEQISFAEKRLRNSYIYGNIITPIPGAILTGFGIYELLNHNNSGVNLVKAGVITLVSMEAVYQSGKWLLRWW